MGEYEIELVMKNGNSVIGEADDWAAALSLMDKAIRRHPSSHIRIRRGTTIIAERVPPWKPRGPAPASRRPGTSSG
jgi:hypothetical protein